MPDRALLLAGLVTLARCGFDCFKLIRCSSSTLRSSAGDHVPALVNGWFLLLIIVLRRNASS